MQRFQVYIIVPDYDQDVRGAGAGGERKTASSIGLCKIRNGEGMCSESGEVRVGRRVQRGTRGTKTLACLVEVTKGSRYSVRLVRSDESGSETRKIAEPTTRDSVAERRDWRRPQASMYPADVVAIMLATHYGIRHRRWGRRWSGQRQRPQLGMRRLRAREEKLATVED